jgi:polyhydroxyalkanoate synthase
VASVYKVNLYTDSDVTFLLTSGGHNAGIVSDRRRTDRTYQVGTRDHDEPYVDAETWAALTPRREGSWWPQWERWLAERSSGMTPAPAIHNAIEPAPGQYVLQR